MFPGNRGVGHARHHVSITPSFLQPSHMMKSVLCISQALCNRAAEGLLVSSFIWPLFIREANVKGSFCVCVCECVCACALVFRTEENMANRSQQKLHSGNLRLCLKSLTYHVRCRLKASLFLSCSWHVAPLPLPDWEPAHGTPAGLSFLTEGDWQAGWKCHRVWSCWHDSKHFSISICRNHHSFWPHIRPSNRAPHWKTTTGRPGTYWTRPCHTSSGATRVRGQSIWWPSWPAGHHTTLVWVQGANPPLKWLTSFFPNLNSSPTKSEV